LENVVKTKKNERKYLKGKFPQHLVHDKKNQGSKTANEQLRWLKATRNDCFFSRSKAKNRLKTVKKEKY
jgi:hypothetical protein